MWRENGRAGHGIPVSRQMSDGLASGLALDWPFIPPGDIRSFRHLIEAGRVASDRPLTSVSYSSRRVGAMRCVSTAGKSSPTIAPKSVATSLNENRIFTVVVSPCTKSTQAFRRFSEERLIGRVEMGLPKDRAVFKDLTSGRDTHGHDIGPPTLCFPRNQH